MKYENEIWKDIKGYKNIYQISNFGRVKNVIKCRILKLKQSKGFYIACNLRKKDIVSFKTIHRLVAIAFIPNPSKLKYINHINGIKTDNSIDNLEWVSARENTNHYHSTTEKSSKYTGVSWDKNKNKWGAHIYFEGKLHCLGYCKTEIMAYERRCYFEEQNRITNKYL